MPTLGVVPMVDHGLPDEDGAAPAPSGGSGQRVRIVRGPAASNLDEWWQLREASDCRWATRPADLSDAELVVLPGSKLPAVDVAWMRATGVDAAILSAHRRGVRILAVCGGAQILGEVVEDPHGVEGGGETRGLGLLPATTSLGPTKRVGRPSCQFRADLPAPWADLSGLCVEGYEVHFGQTRGRPPLAPAFTDGSGLVGGSILAVYLHGLAEIRRCSWRSSAGSCRALFPRCSTAWPTWSTGTGRGAAPDGLRPGTVARVQEALRTSAFLRRPSTLPLVVPV